MGEDATAGDVDRGCRQVAMNDLHGDLRRVERHRSRHRRVARATAWDRLRQVQSCALSVSADEL